LKVPDTPPPTTSGSEQPPSLLRNSSRVVPGNAHAASASTDADAEDAIDEVPLGERATHWLSSPSRDGKTVWETSPYLLVGAGAWDTDAASFPEPAMARYGRVGAPGSPWWVMVKRSDK